MDFSIKLDTTFHIQRLLQCMQQSITGTGALSTLQTVLYAVHTIRSVCSSVNTCSEAARSDTYVSSRLSLPLSLFFTHSYRLTHTHTHCCVRLESEWIPLPYYALASMSGSFKPDSYFTLSGRQVLTDGLHTNGINAFTSKKVKTIH